MEVYVKHIVITSILECQKRFTTLILVVATIIFARST